MKLATELTHRGGIQRDFVSTRTDCGGPGNACEHPIVRDLVTRRVRGRRGQRCFSVETGCVARGGEGGVGVDASSASAARRVRSWARQGGVDVHARGGRSPGAANSTVGDIRVVCPACACTAPCHKGQWGSAAELALRARCMVTCAHGHRRDWVIVCMCGERLCPRHVDPGQL